VGNAKFIFRFSFQIMSDWIGLSFFVLLIVGIFAGLKILSKPVKRTEAKFERNAAESASMLGASMNALQELLNPEAAKSKEVQTQMKEGRYNKKKREGKANAPEETETK
jgi:TctA family transporter